MTDHTARVGYRIETGVDPREMIDVFRRSGLAERRPVQDVDRIRRMIRNANLIVGARAGERLVGIARALTDFSYCCYLSDLAVDHAWQGRGIGRELVRRVHEAAGEETTLLLLAAPGADDFYRQIGLVKFDNTWGARRTR
ncbi:MAG: GNAT family N-acetyltransferase [Alphaproteobacteria bacterium]